MKRQLLVSSVLLGVACGGAPARPLSVRDAWTRPADSAAVTAAYLVVVNSERQPVTLKSAASPLAESVALFETMDMGGMVHMMPVDTAPTIAAGDSLVLKESAKHLMVNGLRRKLAAGDSLPLELTFADGRVVKVTAAVRAP